MTNRVAISLNDIEKKEFLKLKEAAVLLGKTESNISYLIQYGRINRYDRQGNKIRQARNGELRVSKRELLDYIKSWDKIIERRKKALQITDDELAFYDVPERERTKHIHRLHPYLGKFIPQLVEYFLQRYWKRGQTVLDPFMGSGTTLVQANEMAINSIGIDISEFNTLIAKVKLDKYDLEVVENDIVDIYKRTAGFSRRVFDTRTRTLSNIDDSPDISDAGEYLTKWFAEQSLKELFYYRNLIDNYKHKDLLKSILCRTARSCRLVPHYDLVSAEKPVNGPYHCHKHGKICTPVNSIIPRLKFYSFDTVRRLKTFAAIRTNSQYFTICADSRSVKLEKLLPENWLDSNPIHGIFTSPPYVGQIDYHEQHRYAYELLGIKRRDSKEIGPKSKGKSRTAQKDYARNISKVLTNVSQYLESTGSIFIVANDKFNLYPTIAEKSGLKIVSVKERPVEDRTERDKNPYSEKIFHMKFR